MKLTHNTVEHETVIEREGDMIKVKEDNHTICSFTMEEVWDFILAEFRNIKPAETDRWLTGIDRKHNIALQVPEVFNEKGIPINIFRKQENQG